jgi:uncharacterized protein (DUF427 family)
MKAVWNNTVIAEAEKDELVYIEGNWYFPPHAIKSKLFKPNDSHTTCFWKGQANYYDVVVGDDTNQRGAWYYPEPMAGSIERVKNDFTNYVAFWNGIEVKE